MSVSYASLNHVQAAIIMRLGRTFGRKFQNLTSKMSIIIHLLYEGVIIESPFVIRECPLIHDYHFPGFVYEEKGARFVDKNQISLVSTTAPFNYNNVSL